MLKMLWAARKQKPHTKKKKADIKTTKKLRTSGFVMNHIQFMKSTAGLLGLGMRLKKKRVITKPTDYVKDV